MRIILPVYNKETNNPSEIETHKDLARIIKQPKLKKTIVKFLKPSDEANLSVLNKKIHKIITPDSLYHSAIEKDLETGSHFYSIKLASKKNLPFSAQKHLLKHPNIAIKRALAFNHTLKEDGIHNRLASETDSLILRGLADNPNLNSEAQNKLARTGNRYISMILRNNPNLTPEAHDILTRTEN